MWHLLWVKLVGKWYWHWCNLPTITSIAVWMFVLCSIAHLLKRPLFDPLLKCRPRHYCQQVSTTLQLNQIKYTCFNTTWQKSSWKAVLVLYLFVLGNVIMTTWVSRLTLLLLINTRVVFVSASITSQMAVFLTPPGRVWTIFTW